MFKYEYDDIIYIFYCEKDNVFYETETAKDCAFPLFNIFDYITPRQLYLYKLDQGLNLFPHRNRKRILVEIIDFEEFHLWNIGNEYYIMNAGGMELLEDGGDEIWSIIYPLETS